MEEIDSDYNFDDSSQDEAEESYINKIRDMNKPGKRVDDTYSSADEEIQNNNIIQIVGKKKTQDVSDQDSDYGEAQK